ncbi:MAG: tRNA (cytidine(34)-2'-O)-methyltransferase [Clostridiales bacterium]|jgi:tRNA (cytidine/uridine-2'-O-)-methyltransferase|nr:tRNA (cytidine(34)-2'-O)-methyltransferase [Clostridiales bacterium]
MNVVLLEPEIPQNTGNIGRTCAATGTQLHLIGPLGFSINEKSIRRAGLDYWPDLNLRYYDSFEEFIGVNLLSPGGDGPKLYMASTKARRVYSDICYKYEDYIMFGKESAGIPEEILLEYSNLCVRIPMGEKYRSLNLSSSAAVVLYEALRQNGFFGLQLQGKLHRRSWDG